MQHPGQLGSMLSQSCAWSNLQYERIYAATNFRNSNNMQHPGQLSSMLSQSCAWSNLQYERNTRSTIFAVCLVKVVLGQICNTIVHGSMVARSSDVHT